MSNKLVQYCLIRNGLYKDLKEIKKRAMKIEKCFLAYKTILGFYKAL